MREGERERERERGGWEERSTIKVMHLTTLEVIKQRKNKHFQEAFKLQSLTQHTNSPDECVPGPLLP